MNIQKILKFISCSDAHNKTNHYYYRLFKNKITNILFQTILNCDSLSATGNIQAAFSQNYIHTHEKDLDDDFYLSSFEQ